MGHFFPKGRRREKKILTPTGLLYSVSDGERCITAGGVLERPGAPAVGDQRASQ